jgi:hypothetical protein
MSPQFHVRSVSAIGLCIAVLNSWPASGQVIACNGISSLELNINTGTSASGALLPFGAADPLWELLAPTGSGLGAFAVQPPTSPLPWAPPIAGSQWISATATNADQPSADFYYESCFCLTDPNGAQIDLSIRADNQAFVYLTDSLATAGNPATVPDFTGTPNSSSPTMSADQTVLKGPFQQGTNCMIIKVRNFGTPPTPTGLDVAATVNAPGGLLPNNCFCPTFQPVPIPLPRCELTGSIVSACCLGPGESPGTVFIPFRASVNLSGFSTCTPKVTASTGRVPFYSPSTLSAGANTLTGIYAGTLPMNLIIDCGFVALGGCGVTLNEGDVCLP